MFVEFPTNGHAPQLFTKGCDQSLVISDKECLGALDKRIYSQDKSFPMVLLVELKTARVKWN